MGYSLGIGLTNDCNLNCAHCYRDTQTINYISLAQVKEICRMIPVDSMGMGTGENAIEPGIQCHRQLFVCTRHPDSTLLRMDTA